MRKRIATGKLTRRQSARLRKAGFGDDELALLVAVAKDPALKNRDLVRSPSKNLAVTARNTAWRDTARFFRLWTVHPQVADASKLGA